MIYFLMMIFVLGVLNILFLCFSVLNILISLEYMIFVLFVLVLFCYDLVIDLVFFFIFSVSESILGLILILLKVSVSGTDMLGFENF